MGAVLREGGDGERAGVARRLVPCVYVGCGEDGGNGVVFAGRCPKRVPRLFFAPMCTHADLLPTPSQALIYAFNYAGTQFDLTVRADLALLLISSLRNVCGTTAL